MMRTPIELAEVLKGLYDESFAAESMESFRISWGELRALAGGGRLGMGYINDVNQQLAEENCFLAPFDKFLAFLKQSDMRNLRNATGRVLEQYMPGDNDDDDEEIISDDDVEISDFED